MRDKSMTFREPDAPDDGGATLADLLAWIGRHVWLLAIFAAVCGLTAWLVARQRPLEYTAATQIMPSQPSQLPSIGVLGGLFGGSSGGGDTQIGLAWLQSRAFLERFILANGIARELLPDSRLGPRLTPADREAAVGAFRKRLTVSVDKLAGSTTVVSVRSLNPEHAAAWANGLVANLNHDLRERAMRRSIENRIYLAQQLGTTQNSDMRQLLAALVGNELKTFMLARQPSGYGFEVLDPAVAPTGPSNLPPLYIGAAGAVFGLLLGILTAIVVDAWRRRPAA